jgi:hypothetical protein
MNTPRITIGGVHAVVMEADKEDIEQSLGR